MFSSSCASLQVVIQGGSGSCKAFTVVNLHVSVQEFSSPDCAGCPWHLECYDVCHLPIWTISNWPTSLWVVLSPFLVLFTLLGSHTVLHYSSLGRTKDLYALSLTVLELIWRFFLRKPNVWFALEVTKLICEFHLSSWLGFDLRYRGEGMAMKRICMLDRCFFSVYMYNFILMQVESHLPVWFPAFQVVEIILISKTRLFKHTENFTTKKRKFSDKKFWYFSFFCSEHRLWVLVRTASPRRF